MLVFRRVSFRVATWFLIHMAPSNLPAARLLLRSVLLKKRGHRSEAKKSTCLDESMYIYIMTPWCVMLTRGGRTCCTFWTLPLGHWWWSNLWNRFVLVLHQTSGQWSLSAHCFAFFEKLRSISIDDFPSISTTSSFCPGKTATGIAGAQTSEAQPLYSRAPGTKQPQRLGFSIGVGCLPGSHGPGIAEVSVHVHDFKLSFGLRRFFVEPSLEFPTSHKSCWFEQSW